jgi:PAS domain S-box-containing protein
VTDGKVQAAHSPARQEKPPVQKPSAQAGGQSGAYAAAIAELRRMAGPLFTALERSGIAMVVTDPRLPDNPVIFVNDGFTRLTLFEPAEVVGRNCRFMQGAGTDPATVDRLRNALQAAEPVDLHILNYRRDGTAFWNALFISPVLDAAGRPAFFLATQTDVTAQHQAQVSDARIRTQDNALAEANERLRMTLSISGVAASWEWDIATGVILGDTRFASLYGLSAEEAEHGVRPARFFSLVHPEDRTRIRLAVGGMLRGAEVLSKEYRLLLADGLVRWVHARGRCYYNEARQPARFSGTLVDITDQKRVEERLRIAQTAGGVGTFEYIAGFGTVSVSAQFCALVGLHSAQDLPVRTLNALVYPGDAPIIDPQARATPGEVSHVELRITRPDTGELRWVTRRGEYVHDGETAGLRFSGVIYDITHAKRIEEQLRTLNETLEARVEERTRERDRIWQASRDLHILCDSSGIFKSVNPAWETELGYRGGELPGRRLTEFIQEADRPAVEAAITRLARGEYVDNLDVCVVCQNGSLRAFSWTCVPETGAFFAAGRDVTQRNELEEQLRQSQKMEAVGQLTGGIAHDFNNLLTGITGSLDLVRRRLAQGRLDDMDRFMAAASTSAHRAAALVHRLLAFSRRQPLDTKALDVDRLIASMEDMLQRTLGEQIRLEVNSSPGVWPAFSDSNQVESAVLNLAINARDAMPDGGTLTIRCENTTLSAGYAQHYQELASGDYVVISVSDTGIGMSPEVVAKAFDPFFTTKPIGQGTGLGLSMIYGFARQSGGHVRIFSTEGVGTTIKLYLPRYTGNGEAETVEQVAAKLPRGEGETVLVVEDEPAVRLLMLEVLHELGYGTIEATDSQTALPVLQSDRRIDLMVSDVGLPGMSGRTLAEVARQYRPGLKVLFVTGYARKAAVKSEFLGGGMDMITKPFAMDVLATKIREILHS